MRARVLKPGRFDELGEWKIAGLGSRRARAYVPPAPPKGLTRPLLLLFDGQNVFGDEGSYSGGWHVHLAIDKMVAQKPVAPIVVGLDHGNEARIDELTPFEDRGRGGKLPKLLDFIEQTLLPNVKARYPIDDGPCAIGGSSLGGLASLYSHYARPHVFDRAMAMSPALWFANRAIYRFIETAKPPEHSRIYMDGGAGEGRGSMVPLALRMVQALQAHGFRRDGDLKLTWRPDPKGTHSESAWRRRFPRALRFLFA